MRCCCCNSEFHPKWDNEKKVFEKDCAKCVASYSKKPPNKFAMSSEETDDTLYDILDKLSKELGVQDNENVTPRDIVRIDNGVGKYGSTEEGDDESDMGRTDWR